MAAAIGGVAASKKILSSTVGAAMEREVSAITIGAMFDTEKASKAYQKMMKDLALDSPVLNYTQMAGGSKRLLALTRDSKTLEKTWRNIEKLQAFAPDKNTDDAIRGIAELASGDIISLREVFNLDKSQLNAIKNLSFDKQVDGLEKMLTKMKITDELINKVGNTTYAKLNMVKEKFSDIFAEMGGPSLDVLSGFFDNILSRLEGPDAARFANVGARWIKNILNGLTSGVISLYDWFSSLTNSPEFQAQTTLFSKVTFVIDDVYERFLGWLNGSGRAKLEKTAESMIQIILASVEASSEAIGRVATGVGIALGNGILSGVSQSLANSWLARLINDPVGFAVNEGLNKITGRQKKWNVFGYQSNINRSHTNSKAATAAPYKPGTGLKFGQIPKRNGGVKYVPRDGAVFSTHRGEMILPRGEADNYRKGKNGNTPVNITLNYQGTGNTEKDAEKLLFTIARLIESEGLQMGRA
ncbi:hypothetical protein [Cytobacillus oceanisediminis]|uniref:hypothetical protein n=1 Tax=Cytobacillus oceanisediminis TaxID=665099 RepID=UPI00373581AE